MVPKLPNIVFGSVILPSLTNPFEERFNSWRDLKKLKFGGNEMSSFEEISRRFKAYSLPNSDKCVAGTLL